VVCEEVAAPLVSVEPPAGALLRLWLALGELAGVLEPPATVRPAWLVLVPPAPGADLVGAAVVRFAEAARPAATTGAAAVLPMLSPGALLTCLATGCLALGAAPPTALKVPSTPPPATTAAATTAAALPRPNRGDAGSANRDTVGID
jgi:hypothetical protein